MQFIVVLHPLDGISHMGSLSDAFSVYENTPTSEGVAVCNRSHRYASFG